GGAPPAATSEPAAAPSVRAKPVEGPTGLDLYVFVKKLSRVNARPETAFTPGQAEKLSDLLEPLFEKPELDPRETHGVLADARRVLTRAQMSALDAIHDITPASVMPPAPAGPPRGGGPFGFFGGP